MKKLKYWNVELLNIFSKKESGLELANGGFEFLVIKWQKEGANNDFALFHIFFVARKLTTLIIFNKTII